ncbi:MAG: TRL-like family protein [Gammaproteobacteria bacterium]
MNRFLKLAVALVLSGLLAGCVVGPVPGWVYTNAKFPMLATGSSKEPTRVGRATVRSIFFAFSTGDASIQTAAQNGGITEIHHVDYEAQNVLGIVTDYTVVVYGN